MPRKLHEDEMSEAEYKEFQSLIAYDAASLRAQALWLNKKRKNRQLIYQASAELQRDARNAAKAVTFFNPYFTQEEAYQSLTGMQYMMLFEYAKLKKELATLLFAEHGFSQPMYVLREIVESAKPKRAKRENVPEKCAQLVLQWREEAAHTAPTREERVRLDAQGGCADDLADIKGVAKVVKKLLEEQNTNGEVQNECDAEHVSRPCLETVAQNQC